LKLFILIVIFLNSSEGTLQFKIPKLSSYNGIKKKEEIYSTDVLFLKNLPLKIVVQFNPNETKDDIDVGIHVSARQVQEKYKSQ
jgi:hypothetical protein